MRKATTRIAGAFMLLITMGAMRAQMTGTYTIPGNFSSLAAAISSLNTMGVGAGGATINIAAAYTETAPAGGYVLTTSGAAGSPIVFQKSGTGANPLLIAYAGVATPVSASQDGVFSLVGCDYVTIDGINITDPNTANPATMEFGYGLFAANATSGSQYNTIKNCVITLNRVNNAAGTGASAAGSRGINVVGALVTAQTSALAIITTTNGANSYNKFYNNLIQNCNIGICLYGGSTQAYYDTNNDIGGTSAATSNTIVNFGGGATTSAAYGIYATFEQNINIANNIINNNTGAGVNHQSSLYGVYLGAASGVNVNITTNTLTLSNGIASGATYVIYNTSGTIMTNTTTIEISNNLVANCNNTVVTSGSFYGILNSGSANNININNNTFTNNIVGGAVTGSYFGIYNTGSPGNLNINNNTFTATTTQATSGPVYHIYQAGAPTASISIQNNDISWTHAGTVGHTGVFYGIYNTNSTATSTLSVLGNDFSNITRTTVATSETMYFINIAGSQAMRFVNANTFTNLNLNNSYAMYLLYNVGNVTNTLTVNSNSIVGSFSRGTGTSNYLYCIYNSVVTSTAGVKESAYNNFSNISSVNAGAGFFYGVYDNGGGSTTAPYARTIIHNNLFSNINIANTSPASYQFYGVNSNNYVGSDGTYGSAIYSNTITNINYQGVLYGYYMNAVYCDAAHANEIYSNELSNITSGFTTYGMYITPGGNSASAHLKVYKNKLAGITCTANAQVFGIYATSANYADIYNNTIGLLYSNYSSGTAPSIAGVYINSGYTGLWYNTIYLDAGNPASSSNFTVTAPNFASAAVYDYAGGYNLDMRNNILVNTSVAYGTGKTVALWRSIFSLSTHSVSSNNNLYYAGVPSASNVIYYDGGAAFQGMQAYKLIAAPRDSNSVYETATPFISTVPTASDFLHIDPSQYTLARGNGLNIPGISDDFDADIRQGNAGYTGGASAPDIGADEFNLCIPPAPPVSLSALSDYVICGPNGGTTSLTALGNGTINWYSTAVGGSLIASGNSFTTPFLTGNTVFYAAATTSCSSNRTPFNVVVLPKPSVSIMSPTNTICQGTSISLIASGDAATYTWTQNGSNATAIVISPTATTVYSVTASAAYGCTNTASQQIVVNASPSITVSAETNSVICKGEIARLKASGAHTYTWTANSLLANTYSVQAIPVINTTYTVMGTDANGCVGTGTIQQKVNTCTGIQENAGGHSQLSVYPNPTTGAFTVELNNGLDKTLELVDLTGRVVMTGASNDNSIALHIDQFPTGVYYLKVRSNNTVEIVKVVKQ